MFESPGSLTHDPVIRAANLGKSFGSVVALRGLDLVVNPGECFGLLGPNGAGKSTFIGMLYGVVRSTEGQLSVFGMDPRREAARIKGRLGVVTQDNALDENLSVIENMLLYAAYEGLPRSLARGRVMELLDVMSLAHKAHATIQSLSGGMKRRLVFVRALLSRPELLILDEPTTGLDPAVRHLLWAQVRALREKGTTIVLTTHYMHEAEVLCDRLVIMDGGRVVEQGAPRELIQRHCPGYVALLAPQTTDDVLNVLGRDPLLAVHREASAVMIRAEKLPILAQACESHGLTPETLRPANLEDVFLHVTGKGLSNEA